MVGGGGSSGRVCKYISETFEEAMVCGEEHSGFGKVFLASQTSYNFSWVLRGAYGSKIFTTRGPSPTHTLGRYLWPQVKWSAILCGALRTHGRLCVPPARASAVYTAHAWWEEGRAMPGFPDGLHSFLS